MYLLQIMEVLSSSNNVKTDLLWMKTSLADWSVSLSFCQALLAVFPTEENLAENDLTFVEYLTVIFDNVEKVANA